MKQSHGNGGGWPIEAVVVNRFKSIHGFWAPDLSVFSKSNDITSYESFHKYCNKTYGNYYFSNTSQNILA